MYHNCYNLYYKAKDNFDGDLTSKVKVTKKDGKVILKVKDFFFSLQVPV